MNKNIGRENMKTWPKLLASIIAAIILAIAFVGCGTGGSRSQESGAASGNLPNATGSDYVLKYEWPEKPKVGTYTLKVSLTDRSGAPVDGAEVVVDYDMPSMRGHHATTENMKRNASGDYLLPIKFVMPGDWEIVISAVKDDVEIAAELILLDI